MPYVVGEDDEGFIVDVTRRWVPYEYRCVYSCEQLAKSVLGTLVAHMPEIR